MLKFTKFGKLSRNFLNNCSPRIPLCEWNCQNENSYVNKFIKRWQYLQQQNEQETKQRQKKQQQQQHKRQQKRQQQLKTNDYCYQQQMLYQTQQDQLKQYRQNNFCQQQLRERQQQQEQEQEERDRQSIRSSAMKKASVIRESKLDYIRISPEFFSMLKKDDDDFKAAPIMKTLTAYEENGEFSENVKASKPDLEMEKKTQFGRTRDALNSFRQRHLQNQYTIEDPLALENASPVMAAYLKQVMNEDGISKKLFGIDYTTPNTSADKDRLDNLRSAYGGIGDMKGANIIADTDTNKGAGDGFDGFKLVDPFTAAHLLRLLQQSGKLSPQQKSTLTRLLNSLLLLDPDQLMTYLRMIQAQGALTPDVIKQFLRLSTTLGINFNDYGLKILQLMLQKISKEEEDRLINEEKENAIKIQKLARGSKKSMLIEPMIETANAYAKKHKRKHQRPTLSSTNDIYAPLDIEMNWGSANDMINDVRRMTNPKYNESEFRKSLDYYAHRFSNNTKGKSHNREISFSKRAFAPPIGYSGNSYDNILRTSSFYTRASKLQKGIASRESTRKSSASASNDAARMASFMFTAIDSESNLEDFNY